MWLVAKSPAMTAVAGCGWTHKGEGGRPEMPAPISGRSTRRACWKKDNAREAVKALIVANHFLETELEKLRAAASPGFARRKLFEPLPRDRKDWYD
jgi:hypothetical protein